MESKGGKKSSSKSLSYDAPLGYITEDVRPNGGIKKFRSAAYSNVSFCVPTMKVFDTECSGIFNEMTLLMLKFLFSLCSALANHPEIPQLVS